MAIKDLLIGEKKYKVELLSVLDSIDFQIEFAKGLGGFIGKIGAAYATIQNGKEVSKEFIDTLFDGVSPEAIKPLKKKILAQVITPENKFLSDEMVIQEWFSREENKDDLWPVLQGASGILLGEYMPKFLKDLMTMGRQRISAIQEQLKSRTDTDENP